MIGKCVEKSKNKVNQSNNPWILGFFGGCTYCKFAQKNTKKVIVQNFMDAICVYIGGGGGGGGRC